jgi:hypothetical protein
VSPPVRPGRTRSVSRHQTGSPQFAVAAKMKRNHSQQGHQLQDKIETPSPLFKPRVYSYVTNCKTNQEEAQEGYI